MSDDNEKDVGIPGTMTLGIIFLLWFVLIYFVHWFVLWGNWPTG